MSSTWYVSTSGSSANAGSQGSPWALGTLEETTTPKGGDTILLLGGKYGTGVEQYTIKQNGESGNPIIIKPNPGDQVEIDCRIILFQGSFTWLLSDIPYNLEIHCSTVDLTGDPGTDLIRIAEEANGNKLLSAVVHDAAGVGISPQSETSDIEVNGCIVYNCGRAPVFIGTGAAGHGIYPHGTTTVGQTRKIRGNVVLNSVDYGIHAFADTGNLQNLDIENNICIDNGLNVPGEGIIGFDFLVGGQTALQNLVFVKNIALRSNRQTTMSIGYLSDTDPGAKAVSGVVTDNYAHGQITVNHWDGATLSFQRNTVVGSEGQALQVNFEDVTPVKTGLTIDNNTYATTAPDGFGSFSLSTNVDNVATGFDDIASWRTASGFDAHSTLSVANDLGTKAFVFPSDYFKGTGTIAIDNPSGGASVSVAIGSVVDLGQRFAIYSVFDLPTRSNPGATPVITGVFSGGSITVPMTGKVPKAVLGGIYTPNNGLPFLGAFLVVALTTVVPVQPPTQLPVLNLPMSGPFKLVYTGKTEDNNLDDRLQGMITAALGDARYVLQSGISGASGVVDHIVVSPSLPTVVEGQSQQFTAQAFDALGDPVTGVTFTWVSSDSTVMSVDQFGLATAILPGAVAISATVASITGSTAVVISPDTVVASVTVSPVNAVVVVGGPTVTVIAKGFNAEGRALSGLTFNWSSSNTADATVNSSGVVTGVAAGAVSIIATESVSGLSAICTITVNSVQTGLFMTIDKPTFVVAAGDTVPLLARIRNVFGDVAASPPTITWGTTDNTVATVNSSGVVTGVAPGQVQITAHPAGMDAIFIPGVVLSSTYLLRDRWVKANSSSSAGTAETGQTWTAQGTSVAGILTNRLYFPTPAVDSPVIADSTVSDGLFLFKMSSPAFGFAYYFRWTDSNNYAKVFSQAGVISLKGKSGGTNTPLYAFTYPIAPDDTLIIRASGNKIQIQVNGDIVCSINDTIYGGLTGHGVGAGFQASTGASFGRFGEIAVRALDHAISTVETTLLSDRSSASIAGDGIVVPTIYQLTSTGENLSRCRTTSNSGPLIPITYSSSDPTVATVSSQGVIRAVSSGTCTISQNDGNANGIGVTVGSPAGFFTSTAYMHEPAGFTQRTDRDFSQFAPAGNTDPWAFASEAPTSNMTLQLDASAPKSPSTVLQLQYPAQPSTQPVPSGSTFTAGTLELDMAAPHDPCAFIVRWTKLSTAFQGHSTGANKMGEFFFNNGAAGMGHALQGAFTKSSTDQVQPRLCINGGTDFREGLYQPNTLVPDAQQIRGNWHKIAWAIAVNTIAADGSPNFDGQFHLWLDDRKIHEARNLKFVDVTGAGITQWKPSWLWGGLGGFINATFFLWEDHEHVSTGASLGL